ncbi:hypothetical protein V8G54_006349 [Vigna mungo]|uniref:Uncharacterized protein n=1 Tax=Vigna mungo TaxID=3915 RepID=A0AAQ3P212_VIGMU
MHVTKSSILSCYDTLDSSGLRMNIDLGWVVHLWWPLLLCKVIAEGFHPTTHKASSDSAYPMTSYYSHHTRQSSLSENERPLDPNMSQLPYLDHPNQPELPAVSNSPYDYLTHYVVIAKAQLNQKSDGSMMKEIKEKGINGVKHRKVVRVPVKPEKAERTQPMASADKRLEEQLLEAGKKLANPPSSAEELLSLLEANLLLILCGFDALLDFVGNNEYMEFFILVIILQHHLVWVRWHRCQRNRWFGVVPTANSDARYEDVGLGCSSVGRGVATQVESCLSRVEQSPTVSMQNALSPSLKAMVGDQLLRHSDNDVKVAVASCISEITRISAPDAPYDDDQMKEVFHLIVSSFENLHDKLSRSYAKRMSILETVAKVRSCVVMLDLECDALISDMFQHFLKGVREHHPENVVLSMETIMTVVVEESEDISLALLSPLLDSIKKDNEEVFPIAQKLGERVLENCATKLKPYLVQIVRSLDVSVDDYSAVLALICQDTSDDLEKNDTCVTSEHAEDKSDSEKQSLEKSTHVVKNDSREVTSSQRGNPDANKSPNSGMSYGIACVGEDTALAYSNPIKKKEDTDCSNHSEGLNISGHEVGRDLDSKKVDNSKQKAGKATKRPRKKATKRPRKKSSSSTKLAKPSKDQVAANEKETVKMLDCESDSKIVPSSPHKEHFVEAAGPSESNKEIDAKISSPVAVNDESEVVASAPSESLNENHSKKLGRSTKEDDSVKESAAYDVSKVSGGASDSEAKPVTRSVKKALGQKSLKKTSAVDSIKKESGATNNADAKKYSAKKLEENKKVSGGSSSRQAEDRKKGGRGKAKTETDVAKSSAMNVDKEIISTPRSCTKSAKDASSDEKRKLTSGKENEYDTKEYGENLVGLRIKVWWPKDREFYKGIIDSFDSAKKKHKVSYDDGEEEILNLGKEKWKVIEKDSDADEEDRSDHASLDASIDMQPKKKGKTSDGETTKQGKMDVSSRSGGIKTNSRSKSVSLKSSQRSKDGNKLKDSKTSSKSEDGDNKKSKEDTPKSPSSKSIVATKILNKKLKNTDTSRTGELNDDYSSTPKLSSKSKLDILKSGKSKKITPKTAVSKEKPLKSGGKTDVNGTGKMKSDLLKRKYFENDNSDVSEEKLKAANVKTSISSKAQGSEVKSGKKRRRS